MGLADTMSMFKRKATTIPNNSPTAVMANIHVYSPTHYLTTEQKIVVMSLNDNLTSREMIIEPGKQIILLQVFRNGIDIIEPLWLL